MTSKIAWRLITLLLMMAIAASYVTRENDDGMATGPITAPAPVKTFTKAAELEMMRNVCREWLGGEKL